LLTEYLESEAVREAFAAALRNAGIEAGCAEISLPTEYGGVKRYHGVDWWYWLLERYFGSAASFCCVYNYGYTGYNSAVSVGGCAPVFHAGDNRRE
jgi:hypothetical protein